jgi:hypothetical protein
MDGRGSHSSYASYQPKRKRRPPSKCNLLWLAKAPRFLKWFFYDGKELSNAQLHLWSILIGAIVGVVVVAYQKSLEGGVYLVWHLLYGKVKETGIFSDKFPAYNYNWMVATALGIFTGS